ncbi:integrator complex subunit 1 [Solenopsis invicta]|uniref:integrator complex subunit 1 n=1 Tax=Solenopsis invicta TaxID=13686 RepID=UPI0005963B1E|nr:integrator complex subunit 1 [Solenopsis invicta]XP_039302355.1 integrator complex subunit 1 [Solenopsis invicta]XP_039302356.1 integrator complex subunit 1 [Solenopsis invicta]
MERGKTGLGRAAKNKIAQHPSDLFALGSKNSRNDNSDSKSRPGVIHSKPSGSSTTSANDRKKEAPSGSSFIYVPQKKPKLAHVSSHQRQPSSSAEAWEIVVIDTDPADFVPMALEANDNDEGDKVIGIICGAIKTLKNQRWKPDTLLYMGLLYLAKIRPSIFSNDCILHALSSLLRRDPNNQNPYKSKASPVLVSVLAANLLMKGFHDKKNWPEVFVKLYVEDALGERVWVDHEECKGFVDNILSGFNTRHPPKSVLQSEFPVLMQRDCPSPSTVDDEDPAASTSSLSGDKEKIEFPVGPRYAHCVENIELIVLEAVKEQLNRRQAETITRNFLKLLSSACGFVEIRNIAVPRLEVWLHNPKLMRPAQELLIYICYNCTSHTQRDVEVISQLVKMRLKTKAVINLYLNGVKELIGLHPENLATMLKHTIYNELSNARNPNNMPMLGIMFQTLPEQAAKLLAEIFQDLLMNREDYLRPLRALLREIVRVCRHDLNLIVFVRTLMSERSDIAQQLLNFEFKDRMFISIVDLLCLCMLLAISPQVKEAGTLSARADKKDVALLHQFQKLVAMIQYETVLWLQNSAQQMYSVGRNELLHAMHKIMLLESPEHYYKLDNWPPESDRVFYIRLVSDVPLLQTTLWRLLMIGYSKDNGITHSEALDLADLLIRRAAANLTESVPMLLIDKMDVIELIFNLSIYQPPGTINIPAEYLPPTLAIANLYWKGWTMLLILAAHNPSTIGSLGWKRYPILRTLMEMCITNHFSYPPPTMALPEIIEQERAKEMQVESHEKQQILEYETHLAAASTRIQLSEQNSFLLSQLITMDPTGIARRPPQAVLEQIQSLNTSHRLGHLLCRSRKPDFLLDIIQRQQQSTSQSMPWLADLVQNSEGSLSQLPVQCLCEYLLSTNPQTVEKQPRQQQLLAHLQTLLTDPNQDQQHAYEVLEYFLRRLSSQQSSSRVQAITGLKMVLDSIPLEDESMDVDGENEKETWLLRKLPSIPHFLSVRSLVSTALRGACQVENSPDLVQTYISYLAVHTADDDLPDLTDLANEISQLVVERSTIIAAILPQPESDNQRAKQTLHSFMAIFCNYLEKARLPRGEGYQWSESQDQILVQWSNGEECTMHILVVHAMIILLTYDTSEDDSLFNNLLETWFPLTEQPKAFLVDTSEEALLIPDWLKLRMIRSNVPRLVDAALKDLEPQQLVLFIQSFGIPVSSMSKLLHTLDAGVQIDPSSVGEAVLDKTYMAQLVEVQHRRGATGGLVFVQVLLLMEPQLPDEGVMSIGRLHQPLPISATVQKQSVIQCSVKTDVPHLINRLFIENIPINQKMDAYRRLHKTLAKDLQKSCAKESGAVVLAIQHICSVLSSMQVKQFLASLVHMPQYSCTLMRVILLPLKRPSTSKHVVELARNMCLNLISLIGDVKAPVLSILRDFANVLTKTPQRAELSMLMQSRGESPGSILEATDSVNLEGVGRRLLDLCLKQQKNDDLVEAMARLLVSDSNEGTLKPRTGLLIDWLASVEPELIGICPNLQMKLLFGKANVHINTDNNIVSSHSCRPYLLTLLTHRASWTTLYKCVGHLLNKCDDEYDPTAVLDFLWALTCNPKLWQGRDKFTPKHYVPENILLLEERQLLNLVAYLVSEAVIICKMQNRNAALARMDIRLDLLLHCISTEDSLISNVVNYLAERMMDNTNADSMDMAHQFLLHMYMKIPKVICYLNTLQASKFVDGSKITDWTGSMLDCMSHSLLTALAATPRQKSWSSKSQEFELCARKMAAVHPILVLRQLPMLASSLMGRCYLDFSLFKTGHHWALFQQVMGLLELLQPHLFNEQHETALENTLENYFQCFQNYGYMKDLVNLLNRFVSLLQSYISHDPQRAMKYLQKHTHVLHELQINYSNVPALRTLVSGIPIPREGEDADDVLITITPALHPPESTFPQHWQSMLPTLTKMHGEDVFNALQEIDHVSMRKPSVLDPITDNIAELLVSPQGNIRSLAHNILARALKHRPSSNANILSAFQRCLDSHRADVLMSALEKLPDIVLCMQEHALPLMQRVFELGVNSNVNTIPYITKTIALLNTQQGC